MEANPTVLYRVWGTDNIAYGPVELPTVVNWIKQGRVPPNSWIFKHGEGWARASDMPELKILFKSKLPPKSAAAAETLGIQPGSLRRIKMLSEVEDNLLASLLPYLEVVQAPAFEPVVTKGDHGDALFMVLEGELRARVMSADGHELTLSTIGVGECFGELALVDHAPRSADVVANQRSVLIKVSAAALRKMFAEAPALAAPFSFALARVIAQRVRATTRRYEDAMRFSRQADAAEEYEEQNPQAESQTQ